jgi:toxin YoeB
MIEEAKRRPGDGIGKPERLTANLSGYWSRRIDGEHRLVYKVEGDQIVIIQARYHY